DGSVQCWGQNESGQLGNGTTAASAVPVPVPGITDAVAVTGNGVAPSSTGCSGCTNFECARLADGTVRCWGANPDGELGNGTTSLTPTPMPVAVHGLDDVTSVVAGEGHVFAVLSDGTVAAWGANRCGELGDGTTTHADSPVRIPNLDGVTAVAAGF